MKTKVVAGIIASIIFTGVIFAINTIVFPIVLAAAAAIAVYEVEKAIGLKNNLVMGLSLIVAAGIPFLVHFDIGLPLMPVITFYIIILFLFMLFQYDKTKIEHIVFSVFTSLVVPYSLSVMMMFRDIDHVLEYSNRYTSKDGIYFLWFSLLCAWLTDALAYFAGSFLGKHKLCPKISPNKTIEGAIGGIFGTLVVNVVLFLVLDKYIFDGTEIKLIAIIPISIVLSIISICGDLTASVLKRNYGIKDFGKILPGHGGIMDRADSLLFVMPVLYVIITSF